MSKSVIFGNMPVFEQLKNKLLAKNNLDLPSPTHLEVKEDALIAKKVDFDWLAIHLPIIVFPVPGGPNNSKPYK